jgi:hypothetical protein
VTLTFTEIITVGKQDRMMGEIKRTLMKERKIMKKGKERKKVRKRVGQGCRKEAM